MSHYNLSTLSYKIIPKAWDKTCRNTWEYLEKVLRLLTFYKENPTSPAFYSALRKVKSLVALMLGK
jgi:hypothetical protein